ncbi:hypothetical protein Pcinc_004766 [Petrolisthes cinctipes]|uniref:Uncharacterized protein n=1 Tax=Petrolisthes cinctipes TaxID=88211 RepID=A0AAE1FX43_PETCI|nr:hypothetical protein Pcinc_014157 [Petrolisthes cinctipes]KAK3891322.1 hypothetical protein Pcinc_004766 [Petrolisthes cinctipes]
MKFFELFDQDEVSCQTYALYLNSIVDVEAYVSLLRQLYPTISTFVFVVCVRLDWTSNNELIVYLGGMDLDIEKGTPVTGNHYAFCTYELGKSKLYYVDTLGYPIPHNLLESIDEIVGSYRNDLAGRVLRADVIMAHDFSGYGNTHSCASSCSIYPFQSCSTVCGPAVLIGTAIAVHNPHLLELLVSTKKD